MMSLDEGLGRGAQQHKTAQYSHHTDVIQEITSRAQITVKYGKPHHEVMQFEYLVSLFLIWCNYKFTQLSLKRAEWLTKFLKTDQLQLVTLPRAQFQYITAGNL